MNEEFEVGKTYLIFPFPTLVWLENKWIICEVLAIETLPEGCYLSINNIDSNASFEKYSTSPGQAKIFVPRTTLGEKDREIKNKTDLLFAEMDMEELDDSNKYEYTSSCTSSFSVPSNYIP